MTSRVDAHERPRVALVDDDVSVRRAFARLLRPAGFEVDLYPTAYAFLSQPSGRWPDCALIDVRMPGQTGIALVETLQAIAARIPVVLITGDAETSLAARAAKCGAFMLLSKPIEEMVLLAAIHDALSASKRSARRHETRQVGKEHPGHG